MTTQLRIVIFLLAQWQKYQECCSKRDVSSNQRFWHKQLSFPRNPRPSFLRTKSEVFNDQGSTGFGISACGEGCKRQVGINHPVLATWEIRSKNQNVSPKEWESKSSERAFSRTDIPSSQHNILYLVVCSALRKKDGEWACLYERLLPRMCIYDEAAQTYTGKKRVIGRIAGQIAAMVYALLKTDQELLSVLAPNQEPPDPLPYDPAPHKRH